jgi:hypothetical protein
VGVRRVRSPTPFHPHFNHLAGIFSPLLFNHDTKKKKKNEEGGKKLNKMMKKKKKTNSEVHHLLCFSHGSISFFFFLAPLLGGETSFPSFSYSYLFSVVCVCVCVHRSWKKKKEPRPKSLPKGAGYPSLHYIYYTIPPHTQTTFNLNP